MLHNNCKFSIERYFNDSVVIKIQSICGGYLEGADEDDPTTIYLTEKIDNLTTNSGGGFEDWVKDNY
jgi:hypothetical protein